MVTYFGVCQRSFFVMRNRASRAHCSKRRAGLPLGERVKEIEFDAFSFVVFPAKEGVIQLAGYVDGCRKSDIQSVFRRNPREVHCCRPIQSWGMTSGTAVIRQKFTTVFRRANWITPSKAGKTK